ncbi:NifU family protein [Macrococcoides goetzii]|uniref:NifU family protein n=1 Tax=Staphylococcaceae TaxID=90964 RepID=UPI00355927D0
MVFICYIDYTKKVRVNHYIYSKGVKMTTEQQTMFDAVNEVLEKLRPFLLRDGGDCELVDVEDGIVKLRLLGACGTCPSSTITLKAGIERALLEEVPGVVEVEQVF